MTDSSNANLQGRSLRSFFCFFAALVVSFPGARAATLRGTVFDPSGGVVVRARVSLLTPLAALEERTTDGQGRYLFPDLPAGEYRLVANSPGFTATQSDIHIEAGRTRVVDLRLAVSAVSEQVVVSASLGSAVEPELGSSVSVLTKSDLRDMGDQTVFQALSQVPGVAVNQTGRHGGVAGLFIRGGSSNYNLVMIDGLQVNEFGGAFDFSAIPADGVERIEVTRGPESALYGSNAVTGVVNIVTDHGAGQPHFDALAEGGSFTTRRFSTGGSGLTHGFSWAYDISRLDSGGVVRNDNYRDQTAFVSLGYSPSPKRQFNFHFFGNANDAGDPGPYGSDPLGLFDQPEYSGGPTPRQVGEVARDKQNLFGYIGTYSEQFTSRFRQVISAGASTNDYYFIDPYFGDSYSNNLRAIFNTRSEVEVSGKDFLVAGFEYNREQVRNTYVAASNNAPFLLPRTSLAYFAENRWSPTRRLFLTTGVRIDDIRTHSLLADTFAGRPFLPGSEVSQVNPRASVAYLLREAPGGSGVFGATRLHASSGTGIRAPDDFELAFTNNPHLKPERSISFDAGLEQRFFGDRAFWDVTYFYNRFKDQIVVLGGSLTSLSSFSSDNLSNSRAQGLEISFRLRPRRSIQWSGSYTRLSTAILALDGSTLAETPFLVGQPLLREPRNSGATNLTWRHGRLMLNLDSYIRGPVLDVEPNLGATAGLFRNKGYTLVNGGFSYRLRRNLEVYGRLNNLLNQKYEESFGYPALPLNFLAGVRFSFPAE